MKICSHMHAKHTSFYIFSQGNTCIPIIKNQSQIIYNKEGKTKSLSIRELMSLFVYSKQLSNHAIHIDYMYIVISLYNINGEHEQSMLKFFFVDFSTEKKQ